MADTDKPAQQTRTKAAPRAALLIELENVAVKGRRIVCDVLKSVLAEKDIAFTPFLFSRFCVSARARDYVPRILSATNKERLSENKLVSDIEDGIALSFSDGSRKLEPGAAKLLDAAAEKGVALGAVSTLKEEVGKQLVGNLGLAERGVKVVYHQEERRSAPSADGWLALAREVGVRPAACVAVTSCAASHRAALAAGMRSAAVVDDMVAFEDFTGADVVVDGLGDGAVSEIAACLEA